MIVVMNSQASEEQIQAVVRRLGELGFSANISRGVERAVIGVIGQVYPSLKEQLEILPGVEQVLRVTKPYKLASREFQPVDTRFEVGGITIGGDDLVIIAGPCSVESREQILRSAHLVKAAGAHILRGGAFKPRTSPYSFRGLGVQALRWLAEARAETGLPVITEVLAPEDVPLVAEYADILQIGARNMQNFPLLEAAGRSGKPVMVKRGMSATIEEWLLSAEYVLNQGNKHVILCERGIRTFETYTRNTMDVAAIPVVRKLSHLPVFADPSHGTGHRDLVGPMALASVAAGAHGLMMEVHPNPEEALSDGMQSLSCEQFAELVPKLERVAAAVGRRLAVRSLAPEHVGD
jgi:3-deoxy-7-phosphoheptulonate synthase